MGGVSLGLRLLVQVLGYNPNPDPDPNPNPNPNPQPKLNPNPNPITLQPYEQVLGYNFIAFASALTAHLSADYQNNIAKGEAKAKAS